MTKKLTLENNIIAAIRRELTTGNLAIPSAEINDLAETLTQVVFDQLQEAEVDLTAWTTTSADAKRLSARTRS